ncbi:hypothetical protein FB451DRAFT_1552201 [Mycena latifolia]|nr:hypothetical protein FB451DRAFT_1552201 [Mycena latifolia]
MHDKAQLTTAILLWFLSLIPNNALRYALLAIVASLALLYAIHLKCPSSLMSQLEHLIQTTEGIIGDAKLHCTRDLANLLEKGVQLLKIKGSASKIQSRMLETKTLTWKKYRLLSRDIYDSSESIKEIMTAVQLIVEAERQRKYTDDINEMEVMLSTVRSPLRDVLVHEHNISNAHQQFYIVKRSASNIRSHMLENNTLTWKTYRLLWRDISDCVKEVKKIENTLVVEAERQRKYTDDINETETILTSLRSPGMLVYPHTMSNADQESYIHPVSNMFPCYL